MKQQRQPVPSPQPSEDRVTLTITNHVAEVCLNWPEKLDAPMFARLAQIIYRRPSQFMDSNGGQDG